MIDEWIWGDVSGFRPKPGAVVAVHEHTFTLGVPATWSATCTRSARGSRWWPASATTRRAAAARDARALGSMCRGVLTCSDRPTTRKTRVVARGKQVVRADWESTRPLEAADRTRIVACVHERTGCRCGRAQRLREGLWDATGRGGTGRAGRGGHRSATCDLQRRDLHRAQRRRSRPRAACDRRRCSLARAGRALLAMLDCATC